MMELKRGIVLMAALGLSAMTLAGCSTMGGDSGIAANEQPTQLTPVQDSAVDSTTLPPIGGADGSVQVASASPTGQPGTPDPAVTGAIGGQATTGVTTASASPAGQGSFVSLNDVGQVSPVGARDLTGGLTVEKLLGGWTVTSGTTQCRLNLTYTAKTGTDRYRASTPGCQIQALAAVSSWQLVGTQVQLFNDTNTMIGALLLSGNRFIGTLTGGQPISMVG